MNKNIYDLLDLDGFFAIILAIAILIFLYKPRRNIISKMYWILAGIAAIDTKLAIQLIKNWNYINNEIYGLGFIAFIGFVNIFYVIIFFLVKKKMQSN